MLNIRKNKIVKSFSIGLVLLFLIFSIGGVLPVLAAYIGPDRTVTESVKEGSGWGRECQLVAGSYKWVTTTTCDGCLSSCVTKLEAQYPDSNPASICNSSYVGSRVHDYSCSTAEKENTYQPAAISSSIACADPGSDGWCRSDVTVNLTASEGTDACGKYALTLFEDNQANSAPASGCSAAAAFIFTTNGSMDYQAWVHSSLGDTSTITNQTVLIDKVPPSLAYTQPDLFSLELTGLDEHSGIDYFEININGTGWTPGVSHTLLPGVNQIDMRVFDQAGNSTVKSATIVTDNTPPEILSDHISPLSPDGNSGWYITAPTVTVSAEDSQTGITFAGMVLDGIDRDALSGYSIGEGVHSVQIKAVDGAGNQRVEEPMSFGSPVKVDESAPLIHTVITPAPAADDWYGAPVTLRAADSTDAVSGLESIEIDLDGEGFVLTSEIELLEGQHVAVVRVSDISGNQASQSYTINVDLYPPYAQPSVAGNRGPGGADFPWYRSAVSIFANEGDTAGGSLVVENNVNGSGYLPGRQVEAALSGVYDVVFRVTDPVGHQATEGTRLGIDNDAPSFSITSHDQGQVVVSDTILLAGIATDALSGVYQVEVKVADGEWNHYAPKVIDAGAGDAAWEFGVPTTNLKSGSVEVSIRVQDQAGNYSPEKTIQLVVSKRIARLEIPKRWMVGQTITPRHINGDTGSVSRAIASISHPRFGIQTIQLKPANDWAIKWNGYFEAKQVWAPPGEYTIVVTSWDQYGRSSSDSGVIFVPEYPEAPEAMHETFMIRGRVSGWGGEEVVVDGQGYQITSESRIEQGIGIDILVYGEVKKTRGVGVNTTEVLWLKPATEVPIYGLVEIISTQSLQVDGEIFTITADSILPDDLVSGLMVSGAGLDFGEVRPAVVWLELVVVSPLSFSGIITAYTPDDLLGVDEREYRMTEETVILSESGLGVGDQVTGWYLERDRSIVSLKEIEPGLVSFEGTLIGRTESVFIVDAEVYNIVSDSVLPKEMSSGQLVSGQAYLFADGHYEWSALRKKKYACSHFFEQYSHIIGHIPQLFIVKEEVLIES